MEEDVRLPQDERLDGPPRAHESLVPPGSLQRPQQHAHVERHRSQKKRQAAASNQSPAMPFSRLPRTVIEHILYIADASTFASLALLNRKWRRISDSSLLYAHQLSKCPSFSLSQKATAAPALPDDLVHLKKQFFSEIRRNGFDVYLRPHKTLIKLISTSMSSSTAFPHGEAFRFSFSQNAQLILCISSSRIIVLDVGSKRVAVKHELKTWRRPLHATILDDGSLLAVASSSHRVNIYCLSDVEPRLIQELKLNDIPRALALSPTGGVLAIAYGDMIEVYAVGEGVLATERRAVRCAGVDSISFSSDGVILLGSSDDCRSGSLVTISVPFYSEQEADFSAKDVQIQMWTTQILFPDIVQGYSHACLLPLHSEGEGSWILGFDNQIGAFRAIGVSNVNSGTTYFASPVSEDGVRERPPMMLATSDYRGELVALGFQDAGIWVYGVPDRLDIAPVSSNTSDISAMASSSQARQVGGSSTARSNLDRLQRAVNRPKLLISGRKMTDMPGITAARWVRHDHCMAGSRRLAAVAPGGVDSSMIGEEDVPVDGGRVLLLDFARSAKDGGLTEVNIEIGEAEPKMLHEPNCNLDTEVELERRRTRLHRGNTTAQTGRGARDSYPAAAGSSANGRPRRNSSFFSSSSNEGEASQVLDTPYGNAQPRSQDTLRRAATAAAANRRRTPHVARGDARYVYDDPPVPRIFQIPHESDADNWVPPPPPYSSEPDAPLPEYLRRTLLPTMTEPARRMSRAPVTIRRSYSTRLDNMTEESSSWRPLHRLNTVTGPRIASRMRRRLGESDSQDTPARSTSFLRGRSSSATHTPPTSNSTVEPPRARSSPQNSITPPQMMQNITDVSEDTNPTFPVSPPALAAPPLAHQAPVPATPIEPAMPEHPPNDDLSGWQHLLPPIPTTPFAMNMANYHFSVSTPDLQIPLSQPIAPEAMRNRPRIQNSFMRSFDRRSQSHDIRAPPISTVPQARNRRASTDPTRSTSSQSATNEQWRRRIEDWNERTIYERSRRSRSKCRVM